MQVSVRLAPPLRISAVGENDSQTLNFDSALCVAPLWMTNNNTSFTSLRMTAVEWVGRRLR